MRSTDQTLRRRPVRSAARPHHDPLEIHDVEQTPGHRPGQIRDVLDEGRDIVVLGEAGIGKTHLLDLALEAPAPWGAVIVTLPTRARSAGAASPVTLDHPFGADDIQTGPDAAGEALWRWALAQAEQHDGGTPDHVLLRLEDAHLFVPTDLSTIEHAVRRPGAALVATSRTDPALPPVFSELPDLVRFRARPLDEAAVEALLVEMLGGFPTADTVHRLREASRGNPFHLRELVRDQREHGALVADEGIWVWTGTSALTGRLLDAVLHDLSYLDRAERDAVELAAVAGSVPARALPRATRERLLRIGMLRLVVPLAGTEKDGWLEVTHPIQADAICALVGTRRKRELLEESRDWRHASDADELVRNVSRSVGAHVDVSLPELLRACGHAVRSDDPHAAVELTSAALRQATSGHDSIAILTARADAHLHLNDIAAALRDIDEARARLEGLDPCAEEVLETYTRTVRLQAMVLHFLGCDLEATLGRLESARRWLHPAAATDGRAFRALRSVEALKLAHLGWGGRHAEMLEPASGVLADPAHPEDVVPLVGPTIFALTLRGRPVEAELLADRFWPVVAAHPSLHRWEPGAFTLTRFFALVASGEADEAERSEPVPGTVIDRVSLHQRRGVIAAARGRWAEARHELRAANVRLRMRDSLGILAYTLSWEILVAAASGDAAGAREMLDELRGTPRRCSLVAGPLLDLNVLDALIWLHDPRAAALATTLAQEAAHDASAAVELEAIHRLTVIVGPTAAARALGVAVLEDRVRELADRIEGRRASALGAHLRAMMTASMTRDDVAAAIREVGVWLPNLGRPARLTRREREITTLAAGGMSSKAIAQRLVLSVRTVDSHLAGAYAKLGVHTREGLLEALALPVDITASAPPEP